VDDAEYDAMMKDKAQRKLTRFGDVVPDHIKHAAFRPRG